MFSARTQWNTTPNILSDLLAEKLHRGESVVDLTESNPTRCDFSYPAHEILEALADESVLSYRPDSRGLLSARTAIAELYARSGVTVTPEQIILTASTSEAYSFLFKLLCDTGNEVIVPQPSYPLFEYLCQLNDVKLRHYRLAYDGEWHVDFDSLQAVMTGAVRAIVLVHPNNPTGSFLKQKEFDRICSLAAQYSCALIIDEVFGPYVFTSHGHSNGTLESNFPVLSFSLNGISKLLGLPQLKLSWIVVNGTPAQSHEALARLDIIADTFLSVNTPVQAALPKLLLYAADIKSQISQRIQTNYHFLFQCFSGSSISVFYVEGGWYSLLQLPQTRSDEDWAIIFLAQNILVHPGHFFDVEQKSCILVSLLPPSRLFMNTTTQIRKIIEEKQHSIVRK
jgi:alanine-synthesizing transaminase